MRSQHVCMYFVVASELTELVLDPLYWALGGQAWPNHAQVGPTRRRGTPRERASCQHRKEAELGWISPSAGRAGVAQGEVPVVDEGGTWGAKQAWGLLGITPVSLFHWEPSSKFSACTGFLLEPIGVDEGSPGLRPLGQRGPSLHWDCNNRGLSPTEFSSHCTKEGR